MHHELFLALLGHVGDVVEARREGFFVRADAVFVAKPQRTMIDRLLTLGHAFATLEAFVCEAERLPSIYVRALAQGMDQFLQRYADAVVALEAKVLATKVVFPIPQMVYELEEYVELLPELCKLVRKIQVAASSSNGERKCIPGAQLLDLLHRMTSSGFPRIRKSMQELLYYCNRYVLACVVCIGKPPSHWTHSVMVPMIGSCSSRSSRGSCMERSWTRTMSSLCVKTSL